MPDDERALRAELDREFLGELAQRAGELDAAFERAESGGSRPDEAVLAAIGRHAHSISGGSQLVGRSEIGRIAIAMELHVERRRGMDEPLSIAALRDALAAIRALAAGADRSRGDVNALIDRLA